jgi:hypothetical protein
MNDMTFVSSIKGKHLVKSRAFVNYSRKVISPSPLMPFSICQMAGQQQVFGTKVGLLLASNYLNQQFSIHLCCFHRNVLFF